MSEIENQLSRVLAGQYTNVATLDIDSPHRLVVFSDQHKGAGDEADEFRKCKPAYTAALQDYLQRNYTVVLLGDVEELWEQGFKAVRSTHEDVLKLERSFPPGRYYRIWGNHDDDWMSDKKVRKHLAPYLPTGAVYEGLRLELSKGAQPLGTVLMLHGHQGRFFDDKTRAISRWFVRVWRHIQRIFKVGRQTPASNVCLRGKHDTQMYEWAAKQERLVLIAGHTHRPVWSSRTHLQKLEAELRELEKLPGTPENRSRIEAKRAQVEDRAAKYPPCEDTIKTRPCYFNTGCCKFDDGDITGIELEDGRLRLIKWGADRGQPPRRTVLERGAIAEIFEQLRKQGS